MVDPYLTPSAFVLVSGDYANKEIMGNGVKSTIDPC